MIDPRRRRFLRGGIATGADAKDLRAPRPPWSLRPDEQFTTRCTRCNQCVTACPQQVLRAADGGYPVIDFTNAGCSLCGDCSRACPTGAIGPALTDEEFDWRVDIAASCLTRHGVECRICGDACDTRALRFVPARGGIAQLSVDLGACTGCGACQATCPVGAIAMR